MLQLRNTADRYGLVTKALHWGVFVVLVFQFGTGLAGGGEGGHATAGLVLLGLVIVRAAWRMATRLPDWAPSLGPWSRRFVHRLEQVMYVALFAKPITGLLLLAADEGELDLAGFGEFELEWAENGRWEDIFAAAHAWSGYVLLAAVALHVGFVLKHQFINRDRLAFRMLPFTRQ